MNGGILFMKEKNKFYAEEIKLKAIEMKSAGVPVKEIMEKLGIKSESQVYTWWYWFKKGDLQRLKQPIGKQYSYGHGPEVTSDQERIKQLEIQNDILKKYIKMKGRLIGK